MFFITWHKQCIPTETPQLMKHLYSNYFKYVCPVFFIKSLSIVDVGSKRRRVFFYETLIFVYSLMTVP